ncbi:hypothetical protein [Chelativorans salis]|uniref:Stress-induced protein n=1 Tax=Chelativorans salis TaxID=2978478 RepID=A0ABT2LKN8_9HYPH|nr:hypothetical protein [Chelativorans sp. EGI FJ00035]MCT7375155.1 hypothetical protein [Chelativorans sp. EGI FJ00035]
MATNKTNDARKRDRAGQMRSTDLANERMGKNRLQGDDQTSVRNQRHAQPKARREADETMESFEKLDKDKRARTDLGKGNRSGQ